MTIVKKLVDKIEDRKDDDGTIKPRAIVATLLDVVSDGDIDTEDYQPLVDALRQAMAVAIPLINVPYVPAAMEAVAFDSWAIPLAQSYADELVAAVFEQFNIPLPSDAK